MYHCVGCMKRCKSEQPLKTKQVFCKISLGETSSNTYQDHRIPSHRRLSFSALLAKWLVVRDVNDVELYFLVGCCWICFLWINGPSGISVSAVSLTLFAAFKVSFPQRRYVGQMLVTEMNLVTNKFNVFSNKLTRFGFAKDPFKEKRPVKKKPLILILHVIVNLV